MSKVVRVCGVALVLWLLPQSAGAQNRTLTGIAIGAGTGALIAGPVGAVVGGVLGGAVGGPRVTRRFKECWYERDGTRVCRFY